MRVYALLFEANIDAVGKDLSHKQPSQKEEGQDVHNRKDALFWLEPLRNMLFSASEWKKNRSEVVLSLYEVHFHRWAAFSSGAELV